MYKYLSFYNLITKSEMAIRYTKLVAFSGVQGLKA